MSSVVLLVENVNLPLGVVEFIDEEVSLTRVTQTRNRRVVQTQARRNVVYETGPELARVVLAFRMARYSTIVRLDQIRRLESAFTVYPYYPFDTVSAFSMVWPDPNVLEERLRAGYPLANYAIEVEWEEEVGSVCLPPS